jgi:hypothetical protein
MSDFQKLFSSKYVKIDYKSFYFSNPMSINGPFGEFALGSVPGNSTAFGPFRCQLLFGMPVTIDLQTMGECQKTSTGYTYQLKGSGTLHQVGRPPEPYEMFIVVKLDANQQTGTLDFGSSMPEVFGGLPVQRITSALGA